MAALPDRQPDLSQARDRRSSSRSSSRRALARLSGASPALLPLAACALASAVALALALHAGVVGVGAVPAVLRTGAAAVALFGLCGYAPARALIRGELARYRPLLVLPLGATLSSLLLTVLGLFHVPLRVSLAVILAVAVIADLWAVRSAQTTPRDPEHPSGRLAARWYSAAVFLAAMVAAISLIPIFRTGFATVPGENGDSVLVVGSAQILEHAPPTAVRLDQPINRVPLLWRSKYPIYYSLAATATLANEDPIRAFATLSALVLALTALGFFVFARYVLRAPPWLALLAMLLLPLDRIVVYVTIHPYYNELWGQFALPFILLCGWQYLREPGRRSGAAFALFTVLGLLAYPLMLPFPLFFLLAGGWARWRRLRRLGESPGWVAALRLPRPRQRPLLWIPLTVVAVPVALVLIRGFLEKTLSALAVLAPWTSLANWHGAALGYLPWPHFVGMPGSGVADYLGLAAVCGLAVWGIAQLQDERRAAVATMVTLTVLVGVYFRVRSDGELFFFKDLAFLGPYVLLLALLGLGTLIRSRRRGQAALGLLGLAAALVIVPISAASEIDPTYAYATPAVLQLADWNRALARGTSVRIDVPPSGWQLWAMYMFKDHPLCSTDPIGVFFPYPRLGRKADYIITQTAQAEPPDAAGPPLQRNAQFVLWRMKPTVPGPDFCSRRLVEISKVTIGG